MEAGLPLADGPLTEEARAIAVLAGVRIGRFLSLEGPAQGSAKDVQKSCQHRDNLQN